MREHEYVAVSLRQTSFEIRILTRAQVRRPLKTYYFIIVSKDKVGVLTTTLYIGMDVSQVCCLTATFL